MRIGISLEPLRRGSMGGSEVYARNLLQSMFASDRRCEYVLFVGGSFQGEESFRGGNVSIVCDVRELSLAPRRDPPVSRVGAFVKRVVRGGLGGLEVRRDQVWRDVVREYGLDVMFFPLGGSPLYDIGCPVVLTVLDLQHEFFPEYFDRSVLADRARIYQPSCLAATQIISISEHVRQSLIGIYGCDPPRVSVVPLAAGRAFDTAVSEKDVLQALTRYGLSNPYVLYTANFWPHKNHVSLVRAWAEVIERKRLEQYQLVLTGTDFGTRGQVERLVEALGLQSNVRFLGYIPDNDMSILFRGASLLAFPSLFEGFGIPLVEAMASGLPIAASSLDCIREVVGDAAVFFDAREPRSIADAIVRGIQDLDVRSRLCATGRQRARQFSYGACAEGTLNVLGSAIGHYRIRRSAERFEGCAVGRLNHIYKGAYFEFRCPNAVAVRGRIAAASAERWGRRWKIVIRATGGSEWEHVFDPCGNAVPVDIPCTALPSGLVRLEFDLSRLGGCRWEPWPVGKLVSLIAELENQGEFVIIQPSDAEEDGHGDSATSSAAR